ncbi:endonuclease III domain-containing protein [candidate division WOR-3 bacterium]|nr:endonuclease III domain-containing protein [candidate division WOR-3 bacterium]
MKSGTNDQKILHAIFNRLYEYYGPQHWWPADTAFEVMVGAILTQNTNWHNVVQALNNIRYAGYMDARFLYKHRRSIPRLIRPSGFYRLKSKRLVAFLDYFIKEYDGRIEAMKRKRTGTLRGELTAISGIGPETADSILLYALGRPVFVIDAYTRRIGSRHGLYGYDALYDTIQSIFERAIPRRPSLYNEYHALLVRVGKEHCAKHEPLCDSCPVQHILSS